MKCRLLNLLALHQRVRLTALVGVSGLHGLLLLELKLEQLNLLLLLHQGEFCLEADGRWLGLRLLLLLPVENQAGEQVAAEVEELGLGAMLPIAGGFFSGPVAMFRAVAQAAVNACGTIVNGEGTGVATTKVPEGVIDVGANGRSGEGEQGGTCSEGGSGETERGHGVGAVSEEWLVGHELKISRLDVCCDDKGLSDL